MNGAEGHVEYFRLLKYNWQLIVYCYIGFYEMDRARHFLRIFFYFIKGYKATLLTGPHQYQHQLLKVPHHHRHTKLKMHFVAGISLSQNHLLSRIMCLKCNLTLLKVAQILQALAIALVVQSK